MNVAKGHLDDRYVGEDGRSVLLIGQLTVVVSPLATVILDTLAAGGASAVHTTADLARTLVEAFGEPPGVDAARTATEATCRELAECGALEMNVEV